MTLAPPSIPIQPSTPVEPSSTSIFDIKSSQIQAGDTVIVYQSRDNLNAIVVTPGKQLRTKFGDFPHSAMIGTQFGSKCPSHKGTGFTYLLRPTPELWTLALPHRTQILYHPDISFVTSQLDIKPGSYVIEAGTGSGSFSHSVARTIGSKGKLFSFEFHEERYSKAAAEFKAHGLLSTVGGPIQLTHQNVIKDGFGDLGATVDSIFLDLPAPWDALEEAKRVMNRSQLSRICCFSPCIEQVQKTCQTLESLGFSHITMFETLVRTHEPVSVVTLKIDDAVRRIKEVETKKQNRRERQILEAKQRKLAAVEKKSNSNPDTPGGKDTEKSQEGVDTTEQSELKKSQQSALDCDGQLNKTQPQKTDQDKKRSSENVESVEESERKKSRQDLTGDSVITPNEIQADVIMEEILPDIKPILPDIKPVKDSESQSQKTDVSCKTRLKDLAVTQSGNEENGVCDKKPNKNQSTTQQNTNGDPDQTKTKTSVLETSKPACMTRGHTSFLTFAVLLPKLSSQLTQSAVNFN